MPLPANYNNVGLYAAAQIAGLNAANVGGAQQLTAYLGARAPIVQHHFPNGWLNTIRVRVVATLPAPDLNRLWQDMAYANLVDFQAACNSTSPYLFPALQMFSHPLPANIVGITYDDVIYLKPEHQHDLSTIIHELVHTLQWNRFGPADFLTRYIRGFVTSGLNYPANPAEASAYMYQNQFKAAATASGVNLQPVIYTQLNVNPGAPLVAPMIATLSNLAAMGITEGNATTGM